MSPDKPQPGGPGKDPAHKRRVRYPGTHPRRFEQRYKEHAADKFPEIVQQVRDRGGTVAGTHVSILVPEIIAALAPAEGETVADCTLGFGGHTVAFLDKIGSTGRVFAFDLDAAEMDKTRQRLADRVANVVFRRSNFAGIGKAMAEAGIAGYDIIFADLGVSSMQVDNPNRGFTYKYDGPLDMRMDDRNPRTAADLLMSLSEREIAEALDEYADEPDCRAIARQIVQTRGRKPLHRTSDLTHLIFDAKGISMKQWKQRAREHQRELHPAARTFQALRILVNDELGSLRQLLRLAPSCLKLGGRIGIISFHSGEDRLVERAFNEGVAAGVYSSASDEPIRAGGQERFDNPRSASARFRWARARVLEE